MLNCDHLVLKQHFSSRADFFDRLQNNSVDIFNEFGIYPLILNEKQTYNITYDGSILAENCRD